MKIAKNIGNLPIPNNMKINNKPVAGQNIAEHFAEFFDKKVKTIVNETVVDPGVYSGTQKTPAADVMFMTSIKIAECIDGSAFINCTTLILTIWSLSRRIFNQILIGDPIKIKIGNVEITQEKSAKLLGMTMDDNQSWVSHFYGKKGVISSLNQRLFTLRRMKNYLRLPGLRKIADSLFNSKIRYGLQLCSKIRWKESDPTPKLLKDLQLSQNKMLRLLNGTRISDQISTASLLTKFNMLSVNQMNAQIKLSEMWKATNDEDHSFKISKRVPDQESRAMRSISNEVISVLSFSDLSKQTFINDGIKAWNKAPLSIKSCKTYASVKIEIKKFVKTIPI